MILALRTKRVRLAGVVAGLASMPLWLIEESWMAGVTAVGYPLLALYMAIYPAIFIWIGAGAKRLGSWAWLGLGATWVGVETLRGSVVLTGYNWFSVAHPLASWPVAGLARAVGATGVALVVALAAALLAQALTLNTKRRRWAHLVIGAVAIWIAASITGGMMRRGVSRAQTGAPAIRVGVVQTNVPQSNKQGWTGAQRKADFLAFVDLTRKLAQADPKPDVIVWPETMYPGLTLDPEANKVERAAGLRFDGVDTSVFYDATLALSREINIPMLIGAIGVDGRRVESAPAGGVRLAQDSKFNSVYLVEQGAVAKQRYDKRVLTPFGETMPYISWSKWLEQRLLSIGAAGMAFDLDAGKARPPFTLPARGSVAGVRVVTPICFEITKPGLVRHLIFNRKGGRDAAIVINLTNDGWFGGSLAGRLQHLQIARWRAIETATPIVRAANTGVSAALDAAGMLIAEGPDGETGAQNVAGTMLANVPLGALTPSPVFRSLQVAIPWACLLASIGVALAALLNRTPKRRRRNG